MAGAGWYPDPLGRAQVRYFDGTEWSQWAADDGKSRLDAEAALTALPAPPDAPPPGMPPPPGTGWTPSQQAGPGVMRFRSISGLTTALTWILPFTILACLGAAGAYVHHMSIGNKFYNGDFVSISDINDAKDTVNGFVAAFGVLELAVFVLLIIWMFRAAKNTELWNSQRARWTPGWAIGGWFIPVANFVIPFLVFAGIWRRSEPDSPDRARLPFVVWFWWFLFVAGELAVRIDPTVTTKSALDARDSAHIVGFVLLAISAGMLIVVVRRLSATQQRLAGGTGQ